MILCVCTAGINCLLPILSYKEHEGLKFGMCVTSNTDDDRILKFAGKYHMRSFHEFSFFHRDLAVQNMRSVVSHFQANDSYAHNWTEVRAFVRHFGTFFYSRCGKNIKS